MIQINGITNPIDFPILLPVLNYETEVVVNEEWQIPCGKPDISTLETVNLNAEITNYKVIQTPMGFKVIIDGLVNQTVFYTDDSSAQGLHSAHHSEPFSTFIEITLPLGVAIPAAVITAILALLASLGLGLDGILAGPPKVIIEDATVSLQDPRTIKKRVVVFVWITLLEAVFALISTP